MSNTLTMAQIAQQLRLPESTVRYYRDKFSEWIPVVGEGRHRRYPPEAVEILRIIANVLRNHGTPDAVIAVLSHSYPRTIPATIPQQQTAAAQQQSESGLVEAFQALRVAVELQTQQIAGVHEELQQLLTQLNTREEALVAQSRATVSPVAVARPAFWQRLFRPHEPESSA
jgi:DNA-binding transcriptional MerR regulator